MLNLIKESFRLTNKYIILATPLILFSLVSSLYILFSIGGNLISLVIALILFILMLGAFISGWFFMIKKSIVEEDEADPTLLIKEFPSGVGEYFLPVLGLIFTTVVVSLILVIASYIPGMKFIGDIGISANALSGAMASPASMKAFFASLSDEQLFRLNAWNLVLFFTMTVTYFLIMFYSPALFFKQKNPLKAYFVSLKDLFSRKFFNNILLYMFIFVSYFVLSIFTTFAGMNPVIHFVFTLINFYYIVFAAVLIFLYYYKNFVEVGGNLDERV